MNSGNPTAIQNRIQEDYIILNNVIPLEQLFEIKKVVFLMLWPDIIQFGRVTLDVVIRMSVRQSILGVGHMNKKYEN